MTPVLDACRGCGSPFLAAGADLTAVCRTCGRIHVLGPLTPTFPEERMTDLSEVAAVTDPETVAAVTE